MTLAEFRKGIADSDVTDEDINRLRVSALYGRILTKAERVEVAQLLGVLKEILGEARAM